jgi:hypothetical protein
MRIRFNKDLEINEPNIDIAKVKSSIIETLQPHFARNSLKDMPGSNEIKLKGDLAGFWQKGDTNVLITTDFADSKLSLNAVGKVTPGMMWMFYLFIPFGQIFTLLDLFGFAMNSRMPKVHIAEAFNKVISEFQANPEMFIEK